MKNTLTSAFLLGMLALATGCASMTSHANDTDMIAAAEELDARFVSAFNRGDIDAMMTTYWNSPALVSFPPDTLEIRGWTAVKQSLQNSAMPGAQLRLVGMHYQVAGDCVVSWGQWRMTIPGEAQEAAGRYTDVKAERDGKWVFLHDHVSSPMMAGH